MDFDNGPAMEKAEFDSLFDSLDRGGEVARDHEGRPTAGYGALARVGDPERLAAAGLVRTGRSISLTLPVNREPAPDNTKPALHYMVDRGDVEAPEPTANKDFIGLDYHGKAVTHLDALCHIAYRGKLHGGVRSSDVVSSHGSSWFPVSELAQGIITRGVLVDVPAARDLEWLEPGTAIDADDLRDTCRRLGVELQPGDALLLRSGHQGRRRAVGPWDADSSSAGLHPSAMALLAKTGVSVLGADGDSDVRPSPVTGVSSPIHVLALTALGIPLLDNLDLEELSAACREAGRYEFMFVVSPLVVPGGTGSPVNPLAVL